jgi:hypothetical protein
MNINEVLTYISTQATPQEMARIVDAYKFRQDSLRRSAKAQYNRGDKVSWTNSRNGLTMTGTIEKLNQKTVTVRTTQGLWRVSATLLKRG